MGLLEKERAKAEAGSVRSAGVDLVLNAQAGYVNTENDSGDGGGGSGGKEVCAGEVRRGTIPQSGDAYVGTNTQKSKAHVVVGVAENNIGRIVDSSCKVSQGDEVLVCNDYKRAYTTHLAWLIGDGNVVDSDIMLEFEEELRSQVLRAYIRSCIGRLKLRLDVDRPLWFGKYLKEEIDVVPSTEIQTHLKWEGTWEMPDISPYGSHWKHLRFGADNIWESTAEPNSEHKRNMLMRLTFVP
ncbi:unnamed protein product [Sphenostylis stenocarpa]|uniref:Uncharacterized protein n=1 Tax=Sphenostylis stenocarpa TaxID=92480 RepID=A0AA86S0H7_9FABA|nr:unnamed protein product [Sphenostylis stenocarpa]